MTTVSKARLHHRVGALPETDMQAVEQAIEVQLDLGSACQSRTKSLQMTGAAYRSSV